MQKRHQSNSPVKSKKALRPVSSRSLRLSTVLAQDHFFSDFLSLRLTKKNHTLTMMMSVGAASKISVSASAAALMILSRQPLSEWQVFIKHGSWDQESTSLRALSSEGTAEPALIRARGWQLTCQVFLLALSRILARVLHTFSAFWL